MTSTRTPWAILIVNTLGATAASAFAIRGLTRPEYVQPGSPTHPITRFWAASSAVRTVAFTIPLLGQAATTRRLEPQLLTVAGLVQLGDSALGIWQRKADMALAPALMGIVHLASARHLSRTTPA